MHDLNKKKLQTNQRIVKCSFTLEFHL